MIKTKIAVVVLVSMLAASLAVSSASACETRTPGYWKNHLDDWPIEPGQTLTTFVGTFWDYGWGFVQTFTIPSDAMTILQTPVKGDARINLQQKVIAASLSLLSDQAWGWDNDARYGGSTGLGGPGGLLAQANELLEDNPGPWTPRSAADQSGIRAQGLALASQIDYWLNFFDVD